jgi:hypothetical protein
MAEWSEDHVAAIDYFNTQHFGLIDGIWLNWRPGESLRWKVETTGWEGWGVICGKPTHPRL